MVEFGRNLIQLFVHIAVQFLHRGVQTGQTYPLDHPRCQTHPLQNRKNHWNLTVNYPAPGTLLLLPQRTGPSQLPASISRTKQRDHSFWKQSLAWSSLVWQVLEFLVPFLRWKTPKQKHLNFPPYARVHLRTLLKELPHRSPMRVLELLLWITTQNSLSILPYHHCAVQIIDWKTNQMQQTLRSQISLRVQTHQSPKSPPQLNQVPQNQVLFQGLRLHRINQTGFRVKTLRTSPQNLLQETHWKVINLKKVKNQVQKRSLN